MTKTFVNTIKTGNIMNNEILGSTYKLGLGLSNLPYNGILLVVTRRQNLVALKAQTGACYLGSTAH